VNLLTREKEVIICEWIGRTYAGLGLLIVRLLTDQAATVETNCDGRCYRLQSKSKRNKVKLNTLHGLNLAGSGKGENIGECEKPRTLLFP
jgi:hypothetical protein